MVRLSARKSISPSVSPSIATARMRRTRALRVTLGAVVLLAASVASSQAMDFWGEAFVGATFPIAQDDNAAGPQFGLRLPIGLSPLLRIEPYYANSQCGSTQKDFAGFPYERSGFDIHSGGVNVSVRALGLGPWVDLHPYAGVGFVHLGRSGTSGTHAGYNAGLQADVPLGSTFSLNARGEFNMVVDHGTSRKFANLLVGLRTRFLSSP